MALQTFNGNGLFLPRYTTGASFSINSYAVVAINDTTDIFAAVGVLIPATGTLTKVAFCTGSVTTGDSGFKVDIQTVGTDGFPSGTLYKTNSNGTVNIANTDDNVVKECDINGGTGISCTKDDFVAVNLSAASGSANLQLRYTNTGSNGPYCADYNVTTETTWTKISGLPNIAFYIDGAWYCPPGCLLTTTNSSSDAIVSPQEYGAGVYCPGPCTIGGWVSTIAIPAASSFYIRLYSDPTGTPVKVAESPLYDSDMASGTAVANMVGNFTTPYNASAGLYVVVLAPQEDDANLGVRKMVIPNSYNSAQTWGSYGVKYSRENSASGAFSAIDTNLSFIAARIDAISDGVGSGGHPYFGDRSGGKF